MQGLPVTDGPGPQPARPQDAQVPETRPCPHPHKGAARSLPVKAGRGDAGTLFAMQEMLGKAQHLTRAQSSYSLLCLEKEKRSAPRPSCTQCNLMATATIPGYGPQARHPVGP